MRRSVVIVAVLCASGIAACVQAGEGDDARTVEQASTGSATGSASTGPDAGGVVGDAIAGSGDAMAGSADAGLPRDSNTGPCWTYLPPGGVQHVTGSYLDDRSGATRRCRLPNLGCGGEVQDTSCRPIAAQGNGCWSTTHSCHPPPSS